MVFAPPERAPAREKKSISGEHEGRVATKLFCLSKAADVSSGARLVRSANSGSSE